MKNKKFQRPLKKNDNVIIPFKMNNKSAWGRILDNFLIKLNQTQEILYNDNKKSIKKYIW